MNASHYRSLLSKRANAIMTPSDIEVSLETIHEFGIPVEDMLEVDEALSEAEWKERQEVIARINAMPNVLDML